MFPISKKFKVKKMFHICYIKNLPNSNTAEKRGFFGHIERILYAYPPTIGEITPHGEDSYANNKVNRGA